MIKKLVLSLSVASLMSITAFAGINVQYFAVFGVYPNGGDTQSGDPGSGLLAANGTGSALVQLIYAGGDGVANDADPNTAGFVTGDDVVWQTRIISLGAGYDEWGVVSPDPAPFTNPVFTSGNVFVRIFQTETPTAGHYYYDTPLLALEDRGLDIAFAQTLFFDDPNDGVALNILLIPEPSVMAFLGLGGLMLAVRRRIRNA